MIKFIYITDTHGRANSPSSRLDNFSETIIKKMKYIAVAADNFHADFIVHGGDWVHNPDTADSFVRELAKTVKENYHVPLIGILGNHDLYGQNPETFVRTPLGIAEGSGIFKRLTEEPYIFEKDGDKVAITGKDSYFGLDKGNISDYTISKRVDNAINVRVVHGMLLDKKWDQLDYTLIDDIADCNADIILTGHEHVGYGVVEKNGKYFCNPGSLARVTCSTGDINKEVKFALISIDKGNIEIQLIKLPIEIARPANEVLDSSKLIEEKNRKQMINTFSQNVADLKIQGDLDIYKVLQAVADSEKVESNVIEYTRSILEKAQEQLKKGDEEE